MRTVRALGLAFLGMVAPSCAREAAEPHPQAVLVLDTDLPCVGQLPARPELSAQLAVDTLRIDLVGSDGSVIDFRDVSVADPLDWPVSLGVTEPTRFRVRLFAATNAATGVLDGRPTLEPTAALTVDRVIDLVPPSTGVRTALVTLSGDCLGLLPSFTAGTTCVDGTRTAAAASEGIATVSGVDAVVPSPGTWRGAADEPCAGPPAPGRACIPGGVSVLGDRRLAGFYDGISVRTDDLPLHPVRLSPFYLDLTEYTVGRYLAHAGAISGAPFGKDAGSAVFRFCTFDPGGTQLEDLPLNCLDRAFMEQLCEAEGGALPTEAQLLHAISGRGRGQLFPWGNAAPACCTEAVARLEMGCMGDLGPARVRSFDGSQCGGVGDVSRDGAFDLGGNLKERTRDSLTPLDGPCWMVPGIPRDPRCDTGSGPYTELGGSFQEDGYELLPLLRTSDTGEPTADAGFRCAYPGAP